MSNGSETHGVKEKSTLLPYLLILPTVAFLCMFSFYPFIKTIINSFSVTDEIGNWLGWAGLATWKSVFTDGQLPVVLANTFTIAALLLPMTMIGAMTLALIGTKKGKGQRLVTTLFALPLSIAHSAAATVWTFFFGSRSTGGLINNFLNTDILFFQTKGLTVVMVAFVTAWTHTASCYLLLLAGFRNVSDDLLEAATLDGANGFVKATRIMIPMASPQIFYVLFITIISSFATITQIMLLTGGAYGTQNISYVIATKVRTLYEPACCYSLILFVIIFIVTRIQFIFEKKIVYYQ